LTATHETDPQSRRDMREYALPIYIGDDCWLGANCILMPGVRIGKGCTVGAGSIVTKDVPDWSVVVGAPARVVRTVKPIVEKDDEAESTGTTGLVSVGEEQVEAAKEPASAEGALQEDAGLAKSA